ncbi:PIG-L family deacetylase [Paenibacillus sp. CC-CFT747]|nr:PIG-L family deacetylase [Paenibacillus sp. CC-CFT747]
MTHGGRLHPNKYAEEWRKENPDEALVQAGLEEIALNKRRELERAAEHIGISKLILLDYDDNYSTVQEDIVNRIAEELSKERPDIVICDYPMNPAFHNPHTLATQMAFAALSKVSLYLRNLDGHEEFQVKQIFLTTLPVSPMDGLSLNGLRNDVFVDITPVVGEKVRAMDEFKSQGYSGLFARKLIESFNGEYGRAAGVNYAEGFYRVYNETHDHLPLTEAAKRSDLLTRHLTYSTMNLRAMYPVAEES